ncbi:hypothetical protein TrRE_jg10364, partial [Triparma retinervis]
VAEVMRIARRATEEMRMMKKGGFSKSHKKKPPPPAQSNPEKKSHKKKTPDAQRNSHKKKEPEKKSHKKKTPDTQRSSHDQSSPSKKSHKKKVSPPPTCSPPQKSHKKKVPGPSPSAAAAPSRPPLRSPSLSPGRSSGRARKAVKIFNPQDGPASEEREKERVREKELEKKRELAREIKEREREVSRESLARESLGSHDLSGSVTCSSTPGPLDPPSQPGPLCSFCLDSRSFRICLYCACSVCASKHSQSSVLLCDGCDGEFHMGCLEPRLERAPPLNVVPLRVSRSGRVVKPKVRDKNEDYSEYRGITMADRFVGETKQGKIAGLQIPTKRGAALGGAVQPNKKTRNTSSDYGETSSDDEDPLSACQPELEPEFWSSDGALRSTPSAERSRKPGGRECMHVLLKSSGLPLTPLQCRQMSGYAARGKPEQLRILKDAVDIIHDAMVDIYRGKEGVTKGGTLSFCDIKGGTEGLDAEGNSIPGPHAAPSLAGIPGTSSDQQPMLPSSAKYAAAPVGPPAPASAPPVAALTVETGCEEKGGGDGMDGVVKDGN